MIAVDLEMLRELLALPDWLTIERVVQSVNPGRVDLVVTGKWVPESDANDAELVPIFERLPCGHHRLSHIKGLDA